MASTEREPITGVWGQSPQRGAGAEPLVRRSGDRRKLSEDRTSKGRGKVTSCPCFKWETLYSIAGFEWNWWSDCHKCHLESFLVWYTTEDSFIIGVACGKKLGVQKPDSFGIYIIFMFIHWNSSKKIIIYRKNICNNLNSNLYIRSD